MLDQLVESKSNTGENARRSGFLLTTFIILAGSLIGLWTYSLFAKDYGVSDELELSQLVAPVPIAEEEPPPPEPEEPEKKQVVQEKTVDVTMRKEFISRVDTNTEVPDKISTEKLTTKELPKFGKVVQGSTDADAARPTTGARTGESTSTGGFSDPKPVATPEPPKADIPKPPPPPPPKPSKPISKGVVNGSAINLPKPPYPAAARAVRASGAVNVQVLIDENGGVVSANAVSGHPLLRQAAEQAARGARFKPTLLSGQPVKVNGVIVYNFVP